jgi:endonuclease/exonuclease/phosphatase family metal-dependent hydrolase
MKIVSWNLNSLRKRQDRLFDWLEAIKPDIVCLQETKCPDDQFPALALQAVGYRSAYHGEKSYNGVAILAKREPRDVRPSLCDEVVDPQARVIPELSPQPRRLTRCREPGRGRKLCRRIMLVTLSIAKVNSACFKNFIPPAK